MGDVVWTDEAREAVFKAFHEWWDSRKSSASLATDVLATLTPHVEAMVREARAEALRAAADWVDNGTRSDDGYVQRDDWGVPCVYAERLRRWAEEVRRG